MPKIPRTEPTVGFRPTPQPFSTGDGYEAPGKAMQKIGAGIQDLGGAFASLQAKSDRDDEFNTKLNLLNMSNEQDAEDIDRQKTFNVDRDDPDQFAPDRLTSFESRAQSVLDGAKSQRAQQMAALQIARMRGAVGERAQRFGYGQKQQQLYFGTERAITGEFDKLNTPGPEPTIEMGPSPIEGARDPNLVGPTPEEGAQSMRPALSLEQRKAMMEAERLENTLKSAEAIIADMPGSAEVKQRLAKHTAGMMMSYFGKRGESWPAAEDWLRGHQYGGTASGVPTMPSEGGSPIAAAPPGTPGVVSAITDQPYRTFNARGYGERTTGKVTVNGRTYEFVNGGAGRGSIPLGEYAIKRFTTGEQRAREGYKYTKDAFELSDVRDDAPGTKGQAPRQGLLIHDGNRGVTAGCIGVKGDFQQFKADLQAEIQKNGGKGVKLQLGAPNKGGEGGGPAVLSGDEVATGSLRLPGNVTAYSPQAGASNTNSMEGNYQAAKPGPDGKAEVRTLDDFVNGRSPYITVAGNPKYFGREYTIPKISYQGQTLENVPAVVHDTGSAFKNAPEGRFDIPIGKDRSDKDMADHAGSWKKDGIEFVPRQANTIPGKGPQGPQVAQSSYPAINSPVRAEITESLLKAMPAMRERFVSQTDGMMKQVEDLAAKGYEVDDNTINRVAGMVGRTNDPGLIQRMESLHTVIQSTRGINQANVQELTGIIQKAEDQALKGTVTPQQAATIDFLKKKRSETEKAISDNPYEWGTRVGVLPGATPQIAPGAAPQELAEALTARVASRAALMQRVGQELPFFQSQEKQAFTDYMAKKDIPGEVRLGVLRTFYEAFGKETPKALKEIAKDSPELASVGWLVANNADPQAMKDAIRGLDLKNTEGFKTRLPSGDEILKQTDTITGIGNGAFSEVPEAKMFATSVARLIYEARAERKGIDPKLTTVEPTLWTQAVNEAMGQNKSNDGKVTYGGVGSAGGFFGGYKVFVPPWIKTDGGLDETMRNLKWSDLAPNSPAKAAAAAAGREEPGPDVIAEIPSKMEKPANAGPNWQPPPPTTERLPNGGVQWVGSPATASGKQVRMDVLRGAQLVWIGGSRYLLRTGTDGAGQPEYIRTRGAENMNYVLDLEKLRPTLENRMSKGSFRAN